MEKNLEFLKTEPLADFAKRTGISSIDVKENSEKPEWGYCFFLAGVKYSITRKFDPTTGIGGLVNPAVSIVRDKSDSTGKTFGLLHEQGSTLSTVGSFQIA